MIGKEHYYSKHMYSDPQYVHPLGQPFPRFFRMRKKLLQAGVVLKFSSNGINITDFPNLSSATNLKPTTILELSCFHYNCSVGDKLYWVSLHQRRKNAKLRLPYISMHAQFLIAQSFYLYKYYCV